MAAPTTALDDLDLRIGRFAARLYAVATASTIIWALVSGTRWDAWLVGFLLCTTGGSLMPLLPWRNGQLLSKVLISMAGVILTVFMPLFLRQPGLLVLPALSAVYTGASVDHRWMASILPSAIALGVGLAEEQGAAAGWSQAMLYLVLWITTGSVAVWMRNQIAIGNDAILAAQAEAAAEADRKATLQEQAAARAEAELEQRLELAGALQDLVEQATGTSSGIEGQSASIASAVDQLAASLQEASTSAQTTGMTVQRIAEATESSQDLIARLSDAGQQIVGIVDTITALSDQTNLLALNATIEAARAGEAGQGFAVVANEVKDLAQRTARSASGIGELIDEVQGRLNASTEAMSRVAAMVGDLEEQQAALGASVAEQTEVVGGIATAANASAGGVAEFGQIIRQIEQRATVLQATD